MARVSRMLVHTQTTIFAPFPLRLIFRGDESQSSVRLRVKALESDDLGPNLGLGRSGRVK